MQVTRRKLLLATGATVSLAGCIGNSDDGNDTTDDTSNGTDTPDDTPDDDPENRTAEIASDVFHLPPTSSRPLWARDESATGFVTVLGDEYDEPWMVDDPREIDGLRSWLDESDPDASSLVYVQTAAPNACYRRLDVAEVGIENDSIVATASAVDTSEDDEMCATTLTYPSALVRVTADGLPTDATVSVTDGWGESAEIAADGRYVDPKHLPGHVRPGGDPPRVAEFSCYDDGCERRTGPENAAIGEVHDDEELTYAMRVQTPSGDKPRASRGDEVQVTLWNVSTNTQHTGNRHKWTLQVLTTDGWQPVRGTDGRQVGYTDEAIEHRPGGGFEWTFEMTEEGVVSGHAHEENLRVCPDLQAGRYRFVYDGIVSGEPLGVEFHYQG
jgi:hypothetical protein